MVSGSGDSFGPPLYRLFEKALFRWQKKKKKSVLGMTCDHARRGSAGEHHPMTSIVSGSMLRAMDRSLARRCKPCDIFWLILRVLAYIP